MAVTGLYVLLVALTLYNADIENLSPDFTPPAKHFVEPFFSAKVADGECGRRCRRGNDGRLDGLPFLNVPATDPARLKLQFAL